MMELQSSKTSSGPGETFGGTQSAVSQAREISKDLERKRVLVVEDEPEIRELIVLHLQREGHSVDAVGSVEEANKLLNQVTCDLLVLDWMLPGSSGVEMARGIRKTPASIDLPILMVTARAEAADIVEGLEAGADDYLAKPFEPSVLIARVRALLRRSRRQATDDESNPAPAAVELKLGQLTLNTETYEAKCGASLLTLTPSEFKLLVALAHNRGRVLTRDSLISQVQGEGVSVVGRTVDTHIFGLRKKLGDCADVIETVRGIGYRVKSEF